MKFLFSKKCFVLNFPFLFSFFLYTLLSLSVSKNEQKKNYYQFGPFFYAPHFLKTEQKMSPVFQ